MPEKIAFVADGSNQLLDYYTSPKIYPFLDLTLAVLKSYGDVEVKWLYTDEKFPGIKGRTEELGFEFRDRDREIADLPIKKAIERLLYRNDLDIICIGSGDGGFTSHLKRIKNNGKKAFVSSIADSRLNHRLIKEADVTIAINEDSIRSFDSDYAHYKKLCGEISRDYPVESGIITI